MEKNNTGMRNNSFIIRFEDVKKKVEKEEGVLTVDKSHRREFITLVSRFKLKEKVYEDGKICVEPAFGTRDEDLNLHMSTWDMVYHIFFTYANDFWRENERIMKKASSVPFIAVVPQQAVAI